MALSTPTLLGSASNYYGGPYQTGSFSAGAAGRLLVVLCAVGADGSNDAGDLADAVSLSGGGLTWTKVASANHDLGWDEIAVCAFWAISDGTSSMTVSPSVSGSRSLYKFYAQVYEFAADFNASAPIDAVGVTASASATDPDATLSATSDAASCVIGAIFVEGGGSSTPTSAPSGWTEIFDSVGLHWGGYRVGAFSAQPFTGGAWDYVGGVVSVEVVEDTGGGTPIDADADFAEPNETLTGAAAVAVAGVAAFTEPNETLTGVGTVAVVGAAEFTEPNETVAATVAGTLLGTAEFTEPDETLEGAGEVDVVTFGVFTEPNETLEGAGAVAVVGAAAFTEPNETLTGAGAVAIVATAAFTEPNEVINSLVDTGVGFRRRFGSRIGLGIRVGI